MALVEIMFSKNWYTIPKNSGKFTYNCFNTDDFKTRHSTVGHKQSDYSVNMSIPSGYYSCVQDIVLAMNLEIEDKLKSHNFPVVASDGRVYLPTLEQANFPRIKYNDVKKKISIILQGGAYLWFEPYLGSILGIRSNPMINRFQEARPISGLSATDITGGMHALYVYCDILENTPVGDTEAPLLRIVDASGEYCTNIHRTFDPPRYVPVQKKSFDSIEIDIRTNEGEPVAFEGGRSTVTVHFRRAASPYFST